MNKITPKLITEFIGTLFLCLVVALNANAGVANLLAIGSILMVMIYAGGHISGAHYNPAVTLAVLIRGRISMSDAVLYWIVQFAGAAAAAALARVVFETSADGVTGPVADLGRTAALAGEIIGSFALSWVVLNVATAKANAGNSYYGLAIGFTVLACGYVLGKHSGGAFNPAVALSQSIAGFFVWGHMWIYLVGCFGGAAIAAAVFKVCNWDDQ